ncbi:hypothetical protein D3C71_1484330 [compost metagenome]
MLWSEQSLRRRVNGKQLLLFDGLSQCRQVFQLLGRKQFAADLYTVGAGIGNDRQ